MSRLYGTIQESARKTIPTARGHRTIGVTAASWKGSIKTRIYVHEGLQLFKNHGTDTESIKPWLRV